MVKAKVFQTGRSQAIRLPKEFRVDTDEVYLKKTPEGFLVMARDPWEVFHEGCENSRTTSWRLVADNRRNRSGIGTRDPPSGHRRSHYSDARKQEFCAAPAASASGGPRGSLPSDTGCGRRSRIVGDHGFRTGVWRSEAAGMTKKWKLFERSSRPSSCTTTMRSNPLGTTHGFETSLKVLDATSERWTR